MIIMVAYDESKVANEALELACKHAKVFNATIHVVTSMKGGPEVPRDQFEKYQEGLRNAKIIVKRDGIPCETHLSVRGLEPGEDLVQYAKEHAIDEIMIGVRRRSKVGKLVFGSTAQYVILEAPCPVLSVK
jgi:nucleotide-binding universal stress UspA family protein